MSAMTGPQHFRKAEALLAQVYQLDAGDPAVMAIAAIAQVHATLALAAATATGVIAYTLAEGGKVETGPGTWLDVTTGSAS